MILLDVHQLGLLIEGLAPAVEGARIAGGMLNNNRLVLWLDNDKALIYSSLSELNILSVKAREHKISPLPITWVKQVESYIIEVVEQPVFDRLIRFKCTRPNQFGESSKRYIYFELTGRKNNVIITTSDNRIVSSLKVISAQDSSYRQVTAGKEYRYPPALELYNLQEISAEQFQKMIGEASDDKSVLDFLNANFLTKRSIWEELLARLNIAAQTVIRKLSGVKTLYDDLNTGLKELLENTSEHWTLCKTPTGLDLFHFIPVKSDFEIVHSADNTFNVLNYLLDKGLTEFKIDRQETVLTDKIERLKKFFNHSEEQLREELEKNKDYQELRELGDLILSFQAKIKRGMSAVELPNLYGQDTINIELDPGKSPAANAERYYNRSAKMERSIPFLKKRLKEIEVDKRKLNMIKEHLDSGDYDQVADELADYFSESPGIQPQQKTSYKEYSLNEKWKAWVGKTAAANDELTFHVARPEDIWLHAQNLPGSHVIIPKRDSQNVPQQILLKASRLAALNSKGKHSSKVPVIYTQRKYVYKPKGAPPGAVRLRQYSTVIVALHKK